MQTAREKILFHLLAIVPFEGWTEAALAHAAEEAGAHPAGAAWEFPEGVADAAAAFERMADEAMTSRISPIVLRDMRVSERIETLVAARLDYLASHREAVRRLSAYYALPQHAAGGLKALTRTVDAIWYATGDGSADFSFYTKRVTLAGVYSATLLYWLNDDSEDFGNTRAFLARRLAGVMRFHRWKRRCKDTLAPLREFSFRRLFNLS